MDHPYDKVQRYLVYFKYFTKTFRPAMVYPRVLIFPTLPSWLGSAHNLSNSYDKVVKTWRKIKLLRDLDQSMPCALSYAALLLNLKWWSLQTPKLCLIALPIPKSTLLAWQIGDVYFGCPNLLVCS